MYLRYRAMITNANKKANWMNAIVPASEAFVANGAVAAAAA